MARTAEADPSEPNDGTEQRRADPQPPVFSQQQLEICQLHAAMRQREMLTAGFKLTVDAAFIRAAKVTFHAVDACRQAGFGMAGRLPAAIRHQGTAAVHAYLLERQQGMWQAPKFRVWQGKDGRDCAAQDRDGAAREAWRAAGEDLRASEDAM